MGILTTQKKRLDPPTWKQTSHTRIKKKKDAGPQPPNKPPAQSDNVLWTTCSCKINVCRLKFCTFVGKNTLNVDAVLREALWKKKSLLKSQFGKSTRHTHTKKMCVRAAGVFLHKHAECYSTFVSGADSSLAIALLTHKQQASENASFICPFVLWLFSASTCCSVNAQIARFKVKRIPPAVFAELNTSLRIVHVLVLYVYVLQ